MRFAVEDEGDELIMCEFQVTLLTAELSRTK